MWQQLSYHLRIISILIIVVSGFSSVITCYYSKLLLLVATVYCITILIIPIIITFQKTLHSKLHLIRLASELREGT